MPTPAQKTWCLEQAIEIVKHAPADSNALHDRLKRTYKRLLALVDDANETAAAKEAKAAKKAKPAKA
jgi:hypothetical protein